MPINDQSVGRDVTVDIVTSYGLVSFSITTSFHAKPKHTDLKSVALDGTHREGYVPAGWDLTFKLDRGDSTADDYFAQVEADYFAGINQAPGTVQETITNPDGSISQYRYEGVTLKFDDAGEKAGDKLIQMSVAGFANRRKKVM